MKLKIDQFIKEDGLLDVMEDTYFGKESEDGGTAKNRGFYKNICQFGMQGELKGLQDKKWSTRDEETEGYECDKTDNIGEETNQKS